MIASLVARYGFYQEPGDVMYAKCVCSLGNGKRNPHTGRLNGNAIAVYYGTQSTLRYVKHFCRNSGQPVPGDAYVTVDNPRLHRLCIPTAPCRAVAGVECH